MHCLQAGSSESGSEEAEEGGEQEEEEEEEEKEDEAAADEMAEVGCSALHLPLADRAQLGLAGSR